MTKAYPSYMLSVWYAGPMSESAARALLDQSLRQSAQSGLDKLEQRITELVARFYLDKDIEPLVENMLAITKETFQQAVIHLVYGQLLISRKQQGAMEHLQQGFKLGADYFAANDYLEVMKRHEKLSYIHLSSKGQQAQDLNSLLQEADVIHRMIGNRKHTVKDDSDIIG